MKTKLSTLIAVAVLGLSSATFSVNALADQGKMVGPVTKITLAADGKSAVAVLKDGKTGEAVSITVTDDLTLDKFKDKRIQPGFSERSPWLMRLVMVRDFSSDTCSK